MRVSLSKYAGRLSGSGFNYALRTYLIIHGFTDTTTDPWMANMAKNLTKVENVNVILVDWTAGAAWLQPNISNFLSYVPYLQAAENTFIVGKKTAAFLHSAGINLSNVHCIGQSLGAHCCG